MSASNPSQTIAARVAGYTVLALAITLSVGGNCDKTPTNSTTTSSTTTVPATTTTTTSTTTTTIPAGPTTTTTSIAPLDVFISVLNTPCVAPNVGQVSCTFAGSATGGRTPYTHLWTFTNPANNQVVTVNTQQARPELGCGFSSNEATFSVRAVLTVTDASGTAETENRNQQMTRTGCGI